MQVIIKLFTLRKNITYNRAVNYFELDYRTLLPDLVVELCKMISWYRLAIGVEQFSLQNEITN